MKWNPKDRLDVMDKMISQLAKDVESLEARLKGADPAATAREVGRVNQVLMKHVNEQNELDEAREDLLRAVAREYLEGAYDWGLEAVVERIGELHNGEEARVEAWDNKASAGGKIAAMFVVRRSADAGAFGVFVTDSTNGDDWMMFQPVYAGESAIGAAEVMMGGRVAHLRFDTTSIRRFAPAEENEE